MPKSTPKGWHSVTPRIVVHDPARLVRFLKSTFEAAGEFAADALRAGAVSLEEPRDVPYGDRRAMVKDPCGNDWQIATHLGGD